MLRERIAKSRKRIAEGWAGPSIVGLTHPEVLRLDAKAAKVSKTKATNLQPSFSAKGVYFFDLRARAKVA